jgi:hypothetical protein
MNFIKIAPELALTFANAIEFVILTSCVAVLMHYIVGQVAGVGDLVRRLQRVFMHDYQGGAYDIAIAIAVILFGKALRAAVIWEWRYYGGRLSLELLVVAVAIVAIGGLCFIRVLAPSAHYNKVWILVGAAALAFAIASVLTA